MDEGLASALAQAGICFEERDGQYNVSMHADDADRYEGPPAAEDDEDGEPAEPRHRGQRVMRFVCGAYTFEVPRQAYDAWLTAIEAKVSADPDRVIAELKRRLQLQPPNKGSSARRGR